MGTSLECSRPDCIILKRLKNHVQKITERNGVIVCARKPLKYFPSHRWRRLILYMNASREK